IPKGPLSMYLSYGASTYIGRRPSQQDEYLIKDDVFDGSPRATLFGVFDGHGSEGGKASGYVKKIFPDILRNNRDAFVKDACTTMKTVYKTVNEMLADNSAIDTYMSGTTAAVLLFLVDEGRVVVANVGDSRVLLGRKEGPDSWVGVQLTTDHTCSNPEELDRVKLAGARIEQLQVGEARDGPLRIFKGTLPYPGLVVTRSLGDAVAGRLGVLAEPEVHDFRLQACDKFFILGTDGLWDGIEISKAVGIAAKAKGPKEASRVLTKTALEGMDAKHLDDNITNIVVFITEV
ncbi:hypothetical protein HDU76_001348, partial [Blyttiomyces sp. JEL0837]